MKTQKWLTAAGLILALGACTTAPEVEPIASSNQQEEKVNIAPPTVESDSATTSAPDRTKSVTKELPESPVGMRDCALTDYGSKPMTRSENEAIFDPFNFRPESVTVYADTIAVKTTDYTFYYCSYDKNWVPLSNETEAESSEAESPEDRGYNTDDIADPAYQSIEVNGEVYEYRARLEADWLTERAPEGIPEKSPQNEEDTVYFELKLPDGEEISRELYTVSELQAAKLGASLGVPEIAGADAVEGTIWFAATASQGEGDSGFASLIKYDLETETLSVVRPEEIQGDQINDLVATQQSDEITLWLGTQRMGEGVPFFPADGLVAYQPESEELETYTITNSPLVGAIPYALALEKDRLWVATGDGTCRVKWQRIKAGNSWDCWRITARATVPKDGVDLYQSFLATEPKAELTAREVEVLWAAESYGQEPEAAEPEFARYEVVYEPGFEATLSQGGYRVADAAAKRAAMGEAIFWPGRQWHWAGDRFRRGLDEVSLNLVGGGPYGLVSSTTGNGLRFDHKAIRGAFDLLELTAEGTKVRYYSGWVNVDELAVYPRMKAVRRPQKMKPNPLTKMASDLPNSGP